MELSTTLAEMRRLQLPDGGFPEQEGGHARTDSTAWAVIALSAFQGYEESCDQGRAYLASQQAADGRVSVDRAQPDATWPTPLAVLAWETSSVFRQAQERAVQYLLNFSGKHFPNPRDGSTEHDTSIVGWPWIGNTHSWVLPTALAMIALQRVGLGSHSRAIEGQRMLLDRQLKHGGWNYGNTVVFGTELHPLPECTGIALQALAGMTLAGEIERSLDYLLQELPGLRTPISLGWTLLGLGAWGLKPSNATESAVQCLHLQERYGSYSVPSLALLVCSTLASEGLHSLWAQNSDQEGPATPPGS